jgi:hypothetical protein
MLCFFGELEEARKFANLLTAFHIFHTLFCLYALLCLLPFAKKQALAFLNESAALREGLRLIEF